MHGTFQGLWMKENFNRSTTDKRFITGLNNFLKRQSVEHILDNINNG